MKIPKYGQNKCSGPLISMKYLDNIHKKLTAFLLDFRLIHSIVLILLPLHKKKGKQKNKTGFNKTGAIYEI